MVKVLKVWKSSIMYIIFHFYGHKGIQSQGLRRRRGTDANKPFGVVYFKQSLRTSDQSLTPNMTL